MVTNINSVKLKKTNVNGVKCKHINVNGVRVWNAVPDFLYQNGAVDGEYLITMTGSNSYNDNGYGFGGKYEGYFYINENGVMYLSAGASAGYGETYACENKAVSNLMDLSGVTHLHFIGNMYAEGAYHHWQWTNIELIDKNDKTVRLYTKSVSRTASDYSPTNFNIDVTAQIDNLDLDLSSVKLQLRYGYRHNAPWSNWFGGSGRLQISSIGVIS